MKKPKNRCMIFWEKVEKCEHKNISPSYYGGEYCSTPYCGGISEVHCLDCGVFISKCRCGSNDGMDGWSWKQRMNWERKKYGR